MKKNFIIVIFFLFSGFACSQTLTSTISTTHIKYGEPVVLRLEVKAGKSDKIVFPFIKDTLTFHLELLSERRDTIIKDEKYTYIDSISFSAYELGTFTVPSQRVLINSKEFFTPRYKLTIDSMVIDSLKQPLYDIKPIITEPKTFKDYFEQYWVYMIMGLTIFIVAIILAVLYYLERKKKKQGKYSFSNPDVVAIKKIRKLEKTGYLDKGLSKKYYSEMISILKDYMESRWDFPATKLLSDDLLTYMNDKKWISEEEENDLLTVFHAADLAKFAKSRPTIPETKVHTEMVKKFINETKTEFLNFREQNEH